MTKLGTLLLALTLVLGAADADAARRLGGGGSVGQQSSNVARQPASPQPAAPQGQPANATAAQPSPAVNAATAQAAPRSRMGGLLAGAAAGLGLAWLAHSLGFGEAFAQFLLFGLLALVIMVVVGLVLRARRGAGRPAAGYALQGAGAEAPLEPRQYSPDKVGNDASARPWERSSMAFDAGQYAPPGGWRAASGSELAPGWGVPEGFDTESFLSAARRHFITLQDAWDRSDIPLLRSMMTDAMLAEIQVQLAERDRHAAEPNRTEVVMLEARLLGIEDLGAAYMASVEFSGMIREEPSAGPSPFREVWNMTKPRDGSTGWLVAGVQALQ
ncbi:Tim44 domain-containing protein [Ramlibacter sp.]|uniref:Tim44 domain-containing protein n=1 Tax=Ramlibacter sp. TaxID=1917967 RepID=UPI0035B48543